MKVLIIDNIQADKIDALLRESTTILKINNIKRVYNIKYADVIILLINSRQNFVNMNSTLKETIYSTQLPIFIIERLDSSTTWFREFDNIKNLKLVIKNRICYPPNINNETLFYGRYHYQLTYDSYCKENGGEFTEKDLSNSYYMDQMQLNPISEENQKKIIPLLWDFYSSPLSPKCSFRRDNINFDFHRPIDIFCVNHERKGIQGWARAKAKKIVNSMTNYKSITHSLSHDNYEKKFIKV